MNSIYSRSDNVYYCTVLKSNFIWESDNLTEFLNPIDAFLINKNIDAINNLTKKLCEIGVYKGGMVRNLCWNIENCNIVGIDPYPNLDDIRKQFIELVDKNGWSHKVTLLSSKDLISQKLKFDFFHIDGLHTESAVYSDLSFALTYLSDEGFIVVDDIWHKQFPGISYATFTFIANNELVPFMISQNKIFMCKSQMHESYYKRSLELLNSNKIHYFLEIKSGDIGRNFIHSYDIPNTIKGFSLIVVDNSELKEFAHCARLSQITRVTALIANIKKLIKNLIPPIVIEILKKIVRLFQKRKFKTNG